jgi:TRAP-type transport system small permease protein
VPPPASTSETGGLPAFIRQDRPSCGETPALRPTLIETLERGLRRALQGLAVLAAVCLVGTMGIQVFMRYVLRSSLMGSEELSVLFGLWLYFTAFALVSVDNQHIRGGFLLALLPDPVRRAVDRLFLLACAVICGYFFWLTMDYVQFIADTDRRSTFLRWSTVIWVASLVLGLLVSTAALALRGLAPTRGRR